MSSTLLVIGFDLAVSASAVSAVLVRDDALLKGLALGTHESPPARGQMSRRLGGLADWALASVERAGSLASAWCRANGIGPDPERFVGVEDFARGFPYMREEMGMVVGAVRAALYSGGPGRLAIEIETVGVREAKSVACPRWPGLNKVNWTAAGRTEKFKASMPDKASVIAGLQARFRIRARNDHEADACCVALAVGRRHGSSV